MLSIRNSLQILVGKRIEKNNTLQIPRVAVLSDKADSEQEKIARDKLPGTLHNDKRIRS